MGEGTFVARWAAIVITALILQVGLVPQFPVFGVVADLMLLVSVCAGVIGGPERGAIVGFWAGLLFDLARGTGPLGLSALAYTLAGAAVGALMFQLLQMRRLLAVAVVATASAAGCLLYGVEGQLLGQHTLANSRLWTIVLAVALLNGLLAPFGLRICRFAEAREDAPVVLGRVEG